MKPIDLARTLVADKRFTSPHGKKIGLRVCAMFSDTLKDCGVDPLAPLSLEQLAAIRQSIEERAADAILLLGVLASAYAAQAEADATPERELAN
jgi:hypothetical protein